MYFINVNSMTVWNNCVKCERSMKFENSFNCLKNFIFIYLMERICFIFIFYELHSNNLNTNLKYLHFLE